MLVGFLALTKNLFTSAKPTVWQIRPMLIGACDQTVLHVAAARNFGDTLNMILQKRPPRKGVGGYGQQPARGQVSYQRKAGTEPLPARLSQPGAAEA